MAQSNAAAGGGLGVSGRQGAYEPPIGYRLGARFTSIFLARLDLVEALVLTKITPGFDRACVEALHRTVSKALEGRFGPVKFLVLDFAHYGAGDSVGAEGF